MLDERKDVLHGPWYDTSMRVASCVLKALHRMRLASACLTVGQDCSVVALEHRANSMLSCAIINVFLRRIHIVHVIKAVSVPHSQVWVHLDIFGLLSVVNFTTKVLHARDRPIIRRHLHNGKEEVALFFALQRWSHSNHYFEIVLI